MTGKNKKIAKLGKVADKEDSDVNSGEDISSAMENNESDCEQSKNQKKKGKTLAKHKTTSPRKKGKGLQSKLRKAAKGIKKEFEEEK